jgi:hypothetical protein
MSATTLLKSSPPTVLSGRATNTGNATSSERPGTPETGATSVVLEGAVLESLVALVSISDRDSDANQ